MTSLPTGRALRRSRHFVPWKMHRKSLAAPANIGDTVCPARQSITNKREGFLWAVIAALSGLSRRRMQFPDVCGKRPVFDMRWRICTT